MPRQCPKIFFIFLNSNSALGRLLENEKAIELCHSKLIEDLSNDDSTAHGLEMVIKLNFVSDYLINLMLKCFKSDRGMIRTQICETVTVRASTLYILEFSFLAVDTL